MAAPFDDLSAALARPSRTPKSRGRGLVSRPRARSAAGDELTLDGYRVSWSASSQRRVTHGSFEKR